MSKIMELGDSMSQHWGQNGATPINILGVWKYFLDKNNHKVRSWHGECDMLVWNITNSYKVAT